MFARQLDSAGGTARALAPQLARCGTSIAAMLEEARAAESRRDFITVIIRHARENAGKR